MFALIVALALAQEAERAIEGSFVPAPLQGLSNVGYGPLRLGSQSPFRAGFAFDVPSSLPTGHWEARESVTWSRMWAHSGEYLLSFETMNRAASVVYGVTEPFQVELGTASSSRFAGDLDVFVKEFHDAFGIKQGGRDTVEEGRYLFRVGDIDVPNASDHESPDQAFLSLHSTLTEGTRDLPAISLSLTVRSGLGDSSHAMDVAGSLTAAKRWGPFHVYGSLAVERYGENRLHGLDLRPFGMSVLMAVEWSVLPGASLVFQHLWTLGSLEGYGELSRPASEVSFGVKAEYVQGCLVEVGLTENVLVFDSSPDFGLHAGVTVRF